MNQTSSVVSPALDALFADDTPLSVRKTYAELIETARDAQFGLMTSDVVILDTETTGLSFKDCELIEIAAARLENGQVLEEFQTFIHPRTPIPAEITQLTHITNGDVIDAPRAEEAVAALADFVGGLPVIAHNAAFDRAFVQKVPGGRRVSDIWIDSLALSRIALPRLKTHKLALLAEAFGCAAVSHRAIDDVRALVGIWRVILAGLMELPAGLLRTFATMHPDVEWSYRPVFAYLADQRGQESFSLRETRKELVKDLDTTARHDAAEYEGDFERISPQVVQQELSQTGVAGRMYGAFEQRPEQVAMATAVTQALNRSEMLAVEAGTGVGKSLAYLLPLALFAKRNKVTCGVATKTNALTDQLIAHELPALNAALDGGLKFVSLKGFDHYPCLRKVERSITAELPVESVQTNGRSKNTIKADMLTALAVILSTVSQAAEGDLDSLGIRWGSVPRQMVTTSSDECQRRRCPFYQDGCLVHGARRQAAAADIVVTNHSLLLRNVEADGRVLPPIRHWVVDEAHSFDSEVRRQWALEAQANKLRGAFERLGGATTGALHRFIVEAQGLEASRPAVAMVMGAASQVGTAHTMSAAFFDALFELARMYRTGSGYDTATLWIDNQLRQTPEWALLSELGFALVEKISDVSAHIGQAQAYVAQSLDDLGGLSDIGRAQAQRTREASAELSSPVRDLLAASDAIRVVLEGTDASYVFYLEATMAKNRRGEERLVAEKLDVGRELAARFYPELSSLTYCSATIAVAKSFDHFFESVGLNLLPKENVVSLQLASSYNFDNHMAVVLPNNLADPYARSYISELSQLLVSVHMSMGGSVLTLFTNRREMELAYNIVQPQLQEAGLELLVQDRKSSVRRLREQFVANKTSSLFALRSFWEGFDAAGETLRCVVIPKLPFANPQDPLVKEREARDRRAWWNHSLPEAVLAIKQAAGRLIRTSDDKGILILADSRLLTKRYGQTFLQSLPTSSITQVDTSRVGEFIALWRRSHKV